VGEGLRNMAGGRGPRGQQVKEGGGRGQGGVWLERLEGRVQWATRAGAGHPKTLNPKEPSKPLPYTQEAPGQCAAQMQAGRGGGGGRVRSRGRK
jgi:hypothetical protein